MPLRIAHKLFLIILLACLLMSSAIVLINWFAFERSFHQYRLQKDSEAINPVMRLVSEYYQNNTAPLNRKQWRQLRLQLTQSGTSLPLLRRLILVDNQENRFFLAKKPSKIFNLTKFKLDKKIKWFNIVNNQLVVAKLGLIHPKEHFQKNEQTFITYTKQTLLWSLLVVVGLSIALGFGFSRLFTQPIIALSKFTKKLSKGYYGDTLPVANSDEFGSLAGDINTLSQQLQANLTARQTWIADISHELRTPVAVMQAQIEAMIDGIRPLDADNTQILAQEIKQLSALINDLHQLSLSDIGALSYQFNPVNISQWLADFLQAHHRLCSEKQLHLRYELSPDVWIQADTKRLLQLCHNLLQNSLRYTDKKGVIEINLGVSNQKMCLTWSDTSPGVEKKQLSKLFERLYRGEHSRHRSLGGSGLGLAICKSIVEAHQGSIEAHNSHLGGISIIVTMPLGTTR